MTHTIWIPDIHNNIHLAEQIVISARPTGVIYAGDYWDNWGDSPDDAERIAWWLKSKITAPEEGRDETFLLGNHDIPYLFPDLNSGFYCSGYTPLKALAIASTKLHHYADRFKLYTWVGAGAWLCTHAGFSKRLYHVQPDITALLEAEESELLTHPPDSQQLHLLHPGKARGGLRPCGGVTWCDWDKEFVPIPGVNQLVGHTPGRTVREKNGPDSRNICADTNMRKYGVYDAERDGWDFLISNKTYE